MERVSFEIERQEILDALHAEAEAHGRTVEAEVAALVERTYQRKPTPIDGDNWVRDLLELAKRIGLRDGLDPYLPRCAAEDYRPLAL